MRWGTNSMLGSLRVDLPDATQTLSIESTFDQGGSAHEAQAAIGDSGRAVFAWNGLQWQLAGIMFAVGSLYTDQQPATSMYGNLTLSADLSFYRSQILDVMAMPEPGGATWPGVALVAVLARRRGARPHRFARSTTRS
jgi:hypothetical protein